MYTTINRVHLEVTSLCNARCPQCMRNFRGTEHLKPGVQETEMSVETISKIFQDENFKDLKSILINGNYGDIIMHSDPLAVVQFLRVKYPTTRIFIHTNGGALKESFWSDLAKLDPIVEFGIDGLEDTHHLYRRNTNFKTVIKNATAFIAAGGSAEWVMNVFKHNQHQVESCRALSRELGFSKFTHRISTRGLPENATIVFDKELNLDYLLEVSDLLQDNTVETKPVEFYVKKSSVMREKFLKTRNLPTDNIINPTLKINWTEQNSEKLTLPVHCKASEVGEIYISAQGMIYPCCWLGIQRADGHAHYYHDFVSMLEKNGVSPDDFDLDKRTLTEVLNGEYFSTISRSFTNNDRLMKCSEVCTSSSYYDKMLLSKLENIDRST